MRSALLSVPGFKNEFYYINNSEIPGELSREKVISLHVKITCYFPM